MTDASPSIIVGLGNPGGKFRNTRHNVGFMVVDELVRRLRPDSQRTRFDALIHEARHGSERIVLVCPQTFMNRSGQSVAPIVRWYRTPLDRLLVVYDDIDLQFATLRLRQRGSSGGHNGLRSIIEHLGTDEIPRLKIGVGRPPGERGAVNHVLNRFNSREERIVPRLIDAAADAVMIWQREGILAAMNRCNGSVLEPDDRPAAATDEPHT